MNASQMTHNTNEEPEAEPRNPSKDSAGSWVKPTVPQVQEFRMGGGSKDAPSSGEPTPEGDN